MVITGSLLRCNRRQRVVLDGISSSLSDVSSGDLPKVVLPGSTIALYADDCKCSRIIDMAGDLELFQQYLDSLHQ